ncbi:uncharacterized protein PV07_03638 [Cladophialophora immunda]|uniref:Uncharacterized protein n=1 Tax=Cladophialophora immunda TaxID=569365 RepID=A0A0D2D8Q3_9EURO|nr:uncharacterized protein PV07_03638 [Cladophialophora immunda]KIW32064.1 hypothetical protein PV07_03638 [Cladophialophora immunda]OQU96770.1 hypothetical protein CLAIMM_02803 [Cladophialophora immunda]
MSNYLPLYVAMSFLMIDGVIEVGFVGSMVGFLHDRAGRFFTINAPNGSFDLHGKPKGLLVNQGHTSNGAAGTAIVLVGFLGLLTIWYEKRRARRTQATNHSGIFVFWVVMTVLSALLTLSALIYTFVVTAQTDDQTINLTVAAANPEPKMYPLDNWTPENWFVAVLALPLAHASDRRDIRNNLRLMRGWRWNLIPLFILGVVVAVLAVWELVSGRRWRQGDSKEKLRNSTQSQSQSY